MDIFTEFAEKRARFSKLLCQKEEQERLTEPKLPKEATKPNPLLLLRETLNSWQEDKAKAFREYEQALQQQKIDQENLELLIGSHSFHLLKRSIRFWREETREVQLQHLKYQRATYYHRRQTIRARFCQWKKYAHIEALFLRKLDHMYKRKLLYVIVNAWKQPVLKKKKAVRILHELGVHFGNDSLVFYFSILRKEARDRKIVAKFHKKRFMRHWTCAVELHKSEVIKKVAEKMISTGANNITVCFCKWQVISRKTKIAEKKAQLLSKNTSLASSFRIWVDVFLQHQKQRKAIAIWCLGVQTRRFLRWRDWVQECQIVREFRLKIFLQRWNKNIGLKKNQDEKLRKAARFFMESSLQSSFYQWQEKVDILKKDKMQKAMKFWRESTLINAFETWQQYAKNQKEKFSLARFESRDAATQSEFKNFSTAAALSGGAASPFHFHHAYAEAIQPVESPRPSATRGARFITKVEQTPDGLLITNLLSFRTKSDHEELQRIEFEF